jgi:hypothetical protein
LGDQGGAKATEIGGCIVAHAMVSSMSLYSFEV